MRILLDMDEVLADFVGAACRLWGLSRAAVEANWEPGVWDMVPPLARALTADRHLGKPPVRITEQGFWSKIDGRSEFWADLEPLPWAYDLVDLAKSMTDDWWIVTAPSACDSSIVGKREWMRRHLPKEFKRLVPTPAKHLLANPTAILVDDRTTSVDDFVEAGGDGIVFPAHHSRTYVYRNDPLDYVARELRMRSCI